MRSERVPDTAGKAFPDHCDHRRFQKRKFKLAGIEATPTGRHQNKSPSIGEPLPGLGYKVLHVIVTLHQRFRQNAQRESTAEGERPMALPDQVPAGAVQDASLNPSGLMITISQLDDAFGLYIDTRPGSVSEKRSRVIDRFRLVESRC
jgi:hypothetical protein